MQRVKDLLRAASAKFEERPIRERLLVLIAAIAVVVTLWHLLFFQGQQQRIHSLQEQIASVGQEISSLQQEKANLQVEVQEEEQRALRRRIEELRENIEKLDQELRDKSSELISPSRMAKQLRNVLQRSSELKLTRMANSPPSKVELAHLLESSGTVKSDSLPKLYRHPLSLTFQGSYPQALRVLERMQDMSSRFFWDQLEYTVMDYPTARLRLNVHTLSLDKAWIGF